MSERHLRKVKDDGAPMALDRESELRRLLWLYGDMPGIAGDIRALLENRPLSKMQEAMAR